MKLEVGMYVRTKDGHIDKIKNIDEEYYCIGEDEEDKLYKIYQLSNTYYDDEFDEDNDWVFEKFIIKASYNIIDILEIEDYVSTITGECAVIVGIYNDINGKKYLRLCNCIGEYYEDDIKSVITHEQMEQMAYKIGE